jgi:general secretion pathway protein G
MLRALQTHRRRNADDGFTLIELLIVIIILGVLAAIVVFSVRGITNKGDTAACQTSISTIDTAAEAALANGKDSSGAAIAPGTDVTTLTLGQLAPSYMHAVPATIGSHNVTGSTTVGTVDGYLAGC